MASIRTDVVGLSLHWSQIVSSYKRKGRGMPFVIAAPCIDVLDQACVRVCPVACIHFEAGKDRKLYIDPR